MNTFAPVLKLLLLLLVVAGAMAARPAADPVKVLLVTAHPDDETLAAATVYKITHELGGIVDQVVITNGEGGYSYSLLAEPVYGLKLSSEPVGREHLPRIRKRETLEAGAILGVRNHSFLDQRDSRFGLDPGEALGGLWDVGWVRGRLRALLLENRYDYVLGLLPEPTTHGHHQAATILALQAAAGVETAPVVLAVATSAKADAEKEFFQLEGFPLTKVSGGRAEFRVDRTVGFGPSGKLNYKIIVNWVIAAHKSQGALQALANQGDYEDFWYFDANGEAGRERTRRFFDSLGAATPSPGLSSALLPKKTVPCR